jgi:hypothetical protein
MASEEGLSSLCFVVLLQLKLLQEKVGPRADEGVSLGGKNRLDMSEFLVQAAREVQDLTRFGDVVADVAQVVGQFLELGAVIRDGEVALHDDAELSFEEDRALHLIVAKEALDVRPDGEGGGIGLVDEVEDALGDGVVDPVGDAAIDLAPFGIALVDERRRTDMADEAEFAKDGVKETLPLAVVGVEKVEMNGNMIEDIDGLDDSKSGSMGFIKEIRDSGVRGGRGVRRRVRHGAWSRGGGSRGSEGH